MKGNPSADFNWVKARHDCSVYEVFKRLQIEVRSDIEERNAIRGDSDGRTFKFTLIVDENQNTFTVIREPSGDQASIVFLLKPGSISVETAGGRPKFKVMLTLNGDGACIPRINDERLERWEVRMKALESLFFE